MIVLYGHRICDWLDTKKSPTLHIIILGNQRKALVRTINRQSPSEILHDRVIVAISNEKDVKRRKQFEDKAASPSLRQVSFAKVFVC
ncbi:hypothetical protein D3C87_1048330 [compost metagenome]